MKFYTALAILFAAASLPAQHIGYLIPAGGRPGETVEVLIGGQGLGGIKNIHFTGEGLTVESIRVMPNIPNIGGKQQRFVATWMRNRVAGKSEIPKKPDDEEELKTWRKCILFDTIDKLTDLEFHVLTHGVFSRRNSLQMSPAINTKAIAVIRIAPDAKPGRREFRVVRGNASASNPLPFYIDTLPGVLEPFMPVPPNLPPRYQFKFPAVINGQILPGEIDSWHFTAKKGDHVVFQTFARSMIPFMGDCVPGYFQCVLDLRDSKKRLIAFADDNGFDPDPVLSCTIPEDGNYVLNVRDALYRGRADFVYRIRAYIGEPPENKLTPPELTAKLPVVETAKIAPDRKVEIPVLLKGCIGQTGTADRFVFRAEKGQKIVAEVFARRSGSRLDSRIAILGPDGKQVAFNDDFPRFLAGPVLQHTDSYLCFTAPETGLYTATIEDTAGHGGKNYDYFLRIDQPRPTFRLYVVPSAKSVAVYGATRIKLQVEPQDGFCSDIKLRVEAPNKYSIIGSDVIPAGTKSVELSLTCPDKQKQLVRAELIAEAEIPTKVCPACGCTQTQTIRGKVIYGDEDTQAFAYTHVIPSEEWLLSKTWAPTGFFNIAYENRKLTNVKIVRGKTVKIVLIRAKLPPKSDLVCQLNNPPEGLTLEKTDIKNLEKGKAQVTLTVRAAETMKPQRFNLPVTAVFNYVTPPNKEGKTFQRRSEFTLPVLLFEITEK